MSCLTIDRQRWIRGTESASCLASPEGALCAIGHYLYARGVPLADMIGVNCPEDVVGIADIPGVQAVLKHWGGSGVVVAASDLAERIMVINDNSTYGDDVREPALADLFTDLDTIVTFIN